MASLPQVQGTWRLGARSALDIRRPPEGWSGVCKPRCPACPISNFQPYLMVPGGPPRALKWPRQPAWVAYLVHFFDLSWPSWAIFGHLSPNMLPRSSQLDAKIAQESPTYGQDRPREPNLWPRSPKILPKSLQPDPPKTSKCDENAVVLFVFTLRPFF